MREKGSSAGYAKHGRRAVEDAGNKAGRFFADVRSSFLSQQILPGPFAGAARILRRWHD